MKQIKINTLNQDISADSTGTLSTLWENFLFNLSGQIALYMDLNDEENAGGNLSWVSQQFFQNILQNELGYWTYAYDTNTLLNWWNNNYITLAMEIAVPLTSFLSNWCNANKISLNSNLLNLVLNNSLGSVRNTSTSNYDVNSVLNSNSNLSIADINKQINTSTNANNSTVGINGQTDTSYTLGNTNNQMSLDNNPIKDSHGNFNGSVETNIDSSIITPYLVDSYKYLTTTFRQIVFSVFKRFVCPIYNLDDDNIEGFNW